MAATAPNMLDTEVAAYMSLEAMPSEFPGTGKAVAALLAKHADLDAADRRLTETIIASRAGLEQAVKRDDDLNAAALIAGKSTRSTKHEDENLAATKGAEAEQRATRLAMVQVQRRIIDALVRQHDTWHEWSTGWLAAGDAKAAEHLDALAAYAAERARVEGTGRAIRSAAGGGFRYFAGMTEPDRSVVDALNELRAALMQSP